MVYTTYTFLNKISYKYIQDSYFYQDFSYVIKSGLGFQYYQETLKKIIHPAGLQLFGEILIRDVIDVTPDIVTDIEVLRNFERMIVQILSVFTVGAEYNYSRITWEIKPQTDLIDVTSPLLNSQEYIIHLVPEGDEVTGITDSRINNYGELVVHISPASSSVISDTIPSPAKKMFVTKTDILPGYGQQTYGSLPLTPFGVYQENWANTTISSVQGIRFSDLYGENPAYQSILNLYVDNTITVEEPFCIAPSAQGMGLLPAMFTAEMTGEKRLNTNAVALFAPTEDGVRMKYLEATTGLKIPDKKLILG